jgi:hypothetical protein
MPLESRSNRLVPKEERHLGSAKLQGNTALLGLALVAVGGISWLLYARGIQFAYWGSLWRSSSEDWKELSG